MGGTGTDVGLYVQTANSFVPASIPDKVNDIAYGNKRYIAVGHNTYFSTDKIEWIPEAVEFGEASCVTYADTFYVGVDGVGIFAYTADEQWRLVYAGDHVFTDAITANGIPLFGTATGSIISGEGWNETNISSGRVKLAYSDKLYAVINGTGTLEVFSGASIASLVSQGANEVEDFYVTATNYDSVNKCVVVAGYATDDASPFFYMFQRGKWLMIFSSIDSHATALCRNALTAGNTLYKTNDYQTFTRLHTFTDFVPNALIYA